MAMRQDASTGEMVDDGQAAGSAVVNKGAVMAVKVYAPFKVYFDGDALSLSAVNETGPFDILPKHHNFLCMLVPCELKLKTPNDEAETTIKISRALMHVKSEKVTVFLDV